VRDSKAKRFRRGQVDNQLELNRLLHEKVGASKKSKSPAP
jgi:hypothetical protein